MEPAFTDGARIGRRTVSADGYAQPVVTIGAQAAERAEPERGPDRPRDTYEVAPPCRNFASLAMFEAIRRASSGFVGWRQFADPVLPRLVRAVGGGKYGG